MHRLLIRGRMPRVQPARLLLRLATARSGLAPMAAGLAILTAGAIWPGVPAVTAMALVTLGATSLTLARFRRTPSLLSIMLAHITIYGVLYALFVAATLDAAIRTGTGFGFVAAVDLVLSICPLAIALDRTWSAVRAGSFE